MASLLDTLKNALGLSLDTPTVDAPPRALPEPARAGQAVGGIAPATLSVHDPRPGGNLTGRFRRDIAHEVATAARRHGVNPATALAMGLQESSLSTANPLNESVPPAGVWDPPFEHPAANAAMNRQTMLDAALQHMRRIQDQHPDEPEERQLQRYNGLGVPKFGSRAYGGLEAGALPANFYGKRILDIRDNVVNADPQLVALTRRIGS
jgi:hypothetical protein